MPKIHEYFIPTLMRAGLFAAILLLANTPYIGTSIKGESKCFEKVCDPQFGEECFLGKQCYTQYEARPSWPFWWPYPEFSMFYDEVQFSAQAIPMMQIAGNAQYYHAEGLAQTLAYWYVIVLLVTFPFGKSSDDDGEERESGD